MSDKTGAKLAPFNPTADSAIEIALRLGAVRQGDVVYDLGCGDGRFLIAACATCSGVQGVGVDYDRDVAERARVRVHASLSPSVAILYGDATQLSLQGGPMSSTFQWLSVSPASASVRPELPGPATLIYCYLVPAGLAVVEPSLATSLLTVPGCRIVTNMFAMKGWAEKGWLRGVEKTKEGLAVYCYAKPDA